ncbi:MAG: PglZ domain-containing protein, partial [Actinobacteria bacterium]|nr:PglZ domain-containing protein [Actinomycetota bacterium]
ADHGQVHVGENIIEPSAALLALTSGQSGEGRMRWFHARSGAREELRDAVRDELGDTGWVRTVDEAIEEGWFGPRVPPPVRSRLGDVVVAAHEPVSYHDPDDSGPFELVCRHGSLTEQEMLVPLLVGRGRA